MSDKEKKKEIKDNAFRGLAHDSLSDSLEIEEIKKQFGNNPEAAKFCDEAKQILRDMRADTMKKIKEDADTVTVEPKDEKQPKHTDRDQDSATAATIKVKDMREELRKKFPKNFPIQLREKIILYWVQRKENEIFLSEILDEIRRKYQGEPYLDSLIEMVAKTVIAVDHATERRIKNTRIEINRSDNLSTQ